MWKFTSIIVLAVTIAQSRVIAADGFAGQSAATDVTYYMRARFYDPTTGTFLGKDPMGGSSVSNAYTYVSDNPVNGVDPLGLFSYWQFGVQYSGEAGGGLETLGGGALVFGGGGTVEVFGVGVPVAAFGYYLGAQGIATMGSSSYNLTYMYNHPNGTTVPLNASGIAGTIVSGIALANGVQDPSSPFSGTTYGVANSIAMSFDGLTTLGAGDIGSDANMAGQAWVANSSGTMITKIYPTPAAVIPLGFGTGSQIVADTSLVGGIADPFVDYLGLNETPGGTEGSPAADTGNLTLSNDGTTIDLGNGYSLVLGNDLSVGGVIINKAATLVGTNLSSITGATYDPTSKQIVFLGSNSVNASLALNMDYFFTAVQAVYGSSVPPFVSLNFPATPATPWTDYGNGDGTWENGETNGFIMRYNPLWPNVDTTIDVPVVANWNGTSYNFTLHFQAYQLSTTVGGRPGMGLTYTGATNLPSGVTLSNSSLFTTGQTPPSFTLTANSQDGNWPVQLYNGSGHSLTVTGFAVIPARQHRQYGGRVDGTRLGWVMFEADRVMKCLAVGKDNLTGAAYSSATINVPGYQNMLERDNATNDTGGFSRMWFEPDQMILQRYVDPTTGQATINFQTSTVELLTEAYLEGQPSDAAAQAFVTQFQNNYSSFSALNFPVLDPTDPTSTKIINVPIFAMLTQAMQAVSVARFFHDNNIPLDTSWMSTYQLPTTYTPLSVPTAENQGASGNEILIYGGVDIITPNGYVTSSGSIGAQGIGQNVISARPPSVTTPTQDLQQQSWSSGAYNAVATSITTDQQIGNTNLAEHDIAFASPGSMSLAFTRYYQSSYVGTGNLGPGWRYPRYVMQFTNPSWYDQNHYMTDASANALATDSNSDTRLRSGVISWLDLQTGARLDFQSSLLVSYSTNSLGNPVVSTTGLTSGDVPTFTPGTNQNGATLVQTTDASKMYVLTMPDGSNIQFDHNGNVLQVTDRHGYSQYYAYDSLSRLSTITDSTSPTPQVITLAYDPTSQLLTSAIGPNSVGVTYKYDSSGRLQTVVHNLSGAIISQYSYNGSNQLVSVTRMDGTVPVNTSPDLKGRSMTKTDALGNTASWSYFKNSSDGSHVTATYNANSGLGTWETGSDKMGRPTYVKDPLNNYTTYGYTGSFTGPTSVQLPTPSDLHSPGKRPAITIGRNSRGLPTTITDPAVPGAKPEQFAYTSANLLTHLSDFGGRTADLHYTASNNLQTISNYHNGNTLNTVLGYQNEYLHTVSDPMNNTWTYGRDNVGRMTSITDPTGVTKGYQYDSLGRLWKVTDPTQSSQIVYGYDTLDRVTSITTPAGLTQYTYDPVHQWIDTAATTTTDGQTTTIQYGHNAQTGQVTTAATTYESQPATPGSGTQTVTEAYSYSPDGYLQSVTPPSGSSIYSSVNSLGQVSAVSVLITGPTITANSARPSIWTNHNSQSFTWSSISNGSLTTTGYNYSEDGPTSLTVNTTGTAVNWPNISDGEHTFRVRAQYSDGSWSSESVFNLWIDTTPPIVTACLTPSPIPAGNATVSINATIIDPLSNWIDYLISEAGTANTGNSVGGTYLGGNMSLFVAANDTIGSYTRNPNIWTGNLDFSGISVYRPGGTFATGATLVTPTDAVVANHVAPAVGTVETFVDNNNIAYYATVSAVTNVNGDLSIVHLNWNGQTPSTLKIYRVLPANYETSLPAYDTSNFAIIAVNQFRQVFCQDAGNAPFSSGMFTHGPSTESGRTPFTLSVVVGDSSYPLFEDINGEPILLGANYTAVSAPSVADNIAAINAAISGFPGDTYSVSTYTATKVSAAPNVSGLAEFPQFRWCVSSDSTRNWSAYSPMTLTNGQWMGTFSEDGSQQTLYYQVQAHDNAGNTTTVGNSAPTSTVLSQNLGFSPQAKLLLASDGNFYGENTCGGTYNDGTIFKVTPAGQVSVVYTFTNADGSAPIGGLVQGSDGNLYGVTSGAQPFYPFSEGLDLFTQGVVNDGTIFRLSLSGAFATVVTFNGSNGGQPNGLMVASNGVMYGSTYSGGTSNVGTVFSLTTNGAFSTIATFNDANGELPLGNLVQGADGSLYGVTYAGPAAGSGSIFKVATSGGTITTVHALGGGLDGANPAGNLVMDSNGNIYGSTQNGGLAGGTLFKITGSGTYSVLANNFSGQPTGLGDFPSPNGPFVIDNAGYIYGTTISGGTNAVINQGSSSDGMIFVSTPTGVLSKLYQFSEATGDDSTAGLIQDSAGNMYGTTAENGINGGGSVFKFTPEGAYTTLCSFAPNPIITAQPAVETVVNGQPVTFSISAISPVYPANPATPMPHTPAYSLSYQWQRSGVNIPGATGATYTIPNTTSSDAGYVYSVVVSNPVSSSTSSAAGLTLTNGPIIGSQPNSQQVPEFATAGFSVVAYGLPPLSYQWQRAPSGSSTYANLNDGSLYSGSGGPTLSVTPESLSESGDSFRCVITAASGGTVTSNVAGLTVAGLGQAVSSGQPASFTVTPTGAGPFTYQWLFNGVEIPGATNATYSIANTTGANAGTYTVVVSGVGGFTATYGLTVNDIATSGEPTMPQWMLILMAALLICFAMRPQKRATE